MKKLQFNKTSFDGAYLIDRVVNEDNRGKFSRIYCGEELDLMSAYFNPTQINLSRTTKKGTIRGMHFQKPPFSEIKYITCLSGKIFDVILDLRSNSSTYMQKFTCILDAQVATSLYIPKGFAHGFQSLTDNVELLYLHSAPYSVGHEFSINPFDPAFQIEWPEIVFHISDKDQGTPFIDCSKFEGFKYEV